MPNDIQFIAGGELEVRADWMWTSTPLASADPPVSGIPGMNGKCYDTSVWPLYGIAFPASSVAAVRAKIRFDTSVDNQNLMHLYDGATEQMRLVYRSTGAIHAVRQSTAIGQSATGLVLPNVTYDLEWRLKVANAGGECAVNLNNAQIICVPPGAGADTQVTGNASVNQWFIGNDTLNLFFDDCVVDRTGEYLGLGQVETLMPNGIGDFSQFAVDNIAFANFQRVNEKPHDSDTSYVRSSGDNIDTYPFEDRSIAGTPKAVMSVAQARVDGGAPPTNIKLVCRIGGTNFESSLLSVDSSTYRNHLFYTWSVNPSTGLPWTDSDINSAQWGIHALGTNVRLTQLGLQVYVQTAASPTCLDTPAPGYRYNCP